MRTLIEKESKYFIVDSIDPLSSKLKSLDYIKKAIDSQDYQVKKYSIENMKLK